MEYYSCAVHDNRIWVCGSRDSPYACDSYDENWVHQAADLFTNYCLICFIKLNEIIQKRSIATIKNNHDRLVFIRPKHSKGTSYFYITEIYTISYDNHDK